MNDLVKTIMNWPSITHPKVWFCASLLSGSIISMKK